MRKLFNPKFLLVAIFLLGLFLRFYSLGDVPSGFHADEASLGYNAYSLLQTGKDEYGNTLPLILKSFGDYKGALYSYLDVPFVFLLGLTSFSVRLPSAILDSFTILLLYFFIKELLGNKKIAIISSFLYAISPWSINISRVTGDVTSGVFFCVFMAYAIQRYIKTASIKWLAFIIISGFASIIAYAPFRFFVVITASIFFLVSLKKIKDKIIFNKQTILIICIFLLLGFLYSLIASVSRFNQVSIFSNTQTELVMQEQIREDQFTPVLITRVFHNKIINYARTIIYNTQQYFTLDFLALNGGYPSRERIPNSGLFYLWEMPFLLIGLYSIVKVKKRNEIFLLLWWILLIIPSVITFDEIPNVHRTLIVLPAIVGIISIGVYSFFVFSKSNLRKSSFLLILAAVAVIGAYEFLYFGHQYFVHQDIHQSWYRGYAYKPLVAELDEIGENYKKIIVTKSKSSPYIYILFYDKYDPKKYQDEGSPRDLDYTGFDKYLFVPLDCPLSSVRDKNSVPQEKEVLYVNNSGCPVPSNAKVMSNIYWEDGSLAFKLLEYISTPSAKIN